MLGAVTYCFSMQMQYPALEILTESTLYSWREYQLEKRRGFHILMCGRQLESLVLTEICPVSICLHSSMLSQPEILGYWSIKRKGLGTVSLTMRRFTVLKPGISGIRTTDRSKNASEQRRSRRELH